MPVNDGSLAFGVTLRGFALFWCGFVGVCGGLWRFVEEQDLPLRRVATQQIPVDLGVAARDSAPTRGFTPRRIEVAGRGRRPRNRSGKAVVGLPCDLLDKHLHGGYESEAMGHDDQDCG
eukprot:gene3824-biopygen9818